MCVCVQNVQSSCCMCANRVLYVCEVRIVKQHMCETCTLADNRGECACAVYFLRGVNIDISRTDMIYHVLYIIC